MIYINACPIQSYDKQCVSYCRSWKWAEAETANKDCHPSTQLLFCFPFCGRVESIYPQLNGIAGFRLRQQLQWLFLYFSLLKFGVISLVCWVVLLVNVLFFLLLICCLCEFFNWLGKRARSAGVFSNLIEKVARDVWVSWEPEGLPLYVSLFLC